MRYRELLRERERVNIGNNVHRKFVSTRKIKRGNKERKKQERKLKEGGWDKMKITEKIERDGNTNKKKRGKGEEKEKRK